MKVLFDYILQNYYSCSGTSPSAHGGLHTFVTRIVLRNAISNLNIVL